MRLLTCSLLVLGAFAIPAWTNTLRTKADNSQLSSPTSKQRGKRQGFFVPDIQNFQDEFLPQEFDPTELIRLSKKKVLPDNAEYLPPHFHRPDDSAEFSCLCKKIQQLNHNVDNRIDVREYDAGDHPSELHFSIFQDADEYKVPETTFPNFEQFENVEFPRDAGAHHHHHGGLPEGFGQPIMIDQQFRETEGPIGREAHLHKRPHHTVIHHHIHGNPIRQKFRQAEEVDGNFNQFRDPILADLNNNRDQQFRVDDNQDFQPVDNEGFMLQNPLELENSSRPEHSRDLQNIKGIIDGLNKFIEKPKPEVNLAKNESKVDEQFERFAGNEDMFREAHDFQQFAPILSELNNNQDQQIRADNNQEFQPVENEGFMLQNPLEQKNSSRPEHSRDLQNIKGIIDGLNKFIEKPKPEGSLAKNESKVDEQFERLAGNDDFFREAHNLQQFREAPILPDLNNNQDQQFRADNNQEFQPVENQGFMLQNPLELENSSRPEHSRDLQNIKGIIDGLNKFIDKPKPEVNLAKNESKVDEQFERFAGNEDMFREAHDFQQFGQAAPILPDLNNNQDQQFRADNNQEFQPVENQGFMLQNPLEQTNSSRPEHSRDLQNIKGIIDGLNKFIDKPKPEVNLAKNESKVDEQFERFAGNEDMFREAHDFQQFGQVTPILSELNNNKHQQLRDGDNEDFQPVEKKGFVLHDSFEQDNSSRPEHSRDLQNIKGLVDSLNKFIEKPKPEVSLNESTVDEQFERFAGNEDTFKESHHYFGDQQFRQAGSKFEELHDVDPISPPDLDNNQDQRQLQDEAQLRDAHLHHHTLIHNHRGLHHQAVVPGFGHGLAPGIHQTLHQSSFQQPHFQHSGFQQPGFHHSTSGFQQNTAFQPIGHHHQSSFQQHHNLQPNTLIQTQSFNSRTNPQQAHEEINQDDTSAQVFDPFHEKDTTMDFLNRHQFDLPHPGFRNIAGESDGHILRRVEGAESREARTFDPRDLFGDQVFNMLANLEGQNSRNAEEAQTFDPTDLFSEEAFPNFMSDLAKQNEGRADFVDVQRNTDLASPHLFNVPRNLDWQRKKRSMLDQILERERQLVESINKTRNEDLNFIGHLGDRLLGDIERRRNLIQKLAAKTKELKPPVDARSRMDLNQLIMEQRQGQAKKKRSIPLMRMISDPKVKLDLPKTMENFGTATKNVFEDEKAPMYHMKHLLGASRNAVLSVMKIPPQNIIIPSDYEIVKKDPEEVSSEEYVVDERDPMGFAKTFKKVGKIVRNSILSSHETANHIGEIAQDVKNVLHTVRHAAPRLILPYSQIPAIHRPPHKAMLITPRILDLTQAQEHQAQEDRKLVKLGHIMDAVGISKPGDSKLALDKIVFEPHYKRLPKPPSEKLAQLYSRFQDNTVDTVGEAVHALEDAKTSVGAKNLHDFLDKMRKALVHPVHHKHKTRKQQKDEEIDKFVQALFDDSKNETVGAGLPLAKELWQPFMGRASHPEPRRSSSGHGPHHHHTLSHRKHAQSSSNVNNETVGAFIEFLKSRDENKAKRDDHQNMRQVLAAINPMMFERMYNETLNVKSSPEEAVVTGRSAEDGDKVGNIMALPSAIMKPFMGQADSDAVQDFLNTYNGDVGEVEAKNDEDVQNPVIVDGDSIM